MNKKLPYSNYRERNETYYKYTQIQWIILSYLFSLYKCILYVLCMYTTHKSQLHTCLVHKTLLVINDTAISNNNMTLDQHTIKCK